MPVSRGIWSRFDGQVFTYFFACCLPGLSCSFSVSHEHSKLGIIIYFSWTEAEVFKWIVQTLYRDVENSVYIFYVHHLNHFPCQDTLYFVLTIDILVEGRWSCSYFNTKTVINGLKFGQFSRDRPNCNLSIGRLVVQMCVGWGHQVILFHSTCWLNEKKNTDVWATLKWP